MKFPKKLKLIPADDPRLNTISATVDKKYFGTAELREFVSKLSQLMGESDGVGISAVQVGVMERIIIIGCRISATSLPTTVMINPEITSAEGVQESSEGCLSFPGQLCKLSRPKKLDITYKDLAGKSHKATIEDFPAVVVSHEYDHLFGLTMFDRVEPLPK